MCNTWFLFLSQELSNGDVKNIILEYKQAALNSMEASFDGVGLHSAFGYLPNQFLAESANQRTDEYRGSNENRNRFVIEVMQEMFTAVGNDDLNYYPSALYKHSH